jgi:hypothetical protein
MDNNILLISIILLLLIIVGLNVYNTYKTQKLYEIIFEDDKQPKTPINTSSAYPYYKNGNQHLISSPSSANMDKNPALLNPGMMRRTPPTMGPRSNSMGPPSGMMMERPPPGMMMEGPPSGMMMGRPSPDMMEGPPPGMMMGRPSPYMMEGPPPGMMMEGLPSGMMMGRPSPDIRRPPPGILDDEIMVPPPEEMYRRFHN